LIGEGILPSLRHALTNLLHEDHVMVPHSATIYGRLIDSPNLWNFQSLDQEDNFLGFKLGRLQEGGRRGKRDVEEEGRKKRNDREGLK
jgi:hypothetical protein